MGIKMAFKKITKEGDWKCSDSKSKIDHEMWRRYDPKILDEDHIFIHRKAEEEVRTEMERILNPALNIARLTLLLSCSMKFASYPHDEQNCHLSMESCE